MAPVRLSQRVVRSELGLDLEVGDVGESVGGFGGTLTGLVVLSGGG